MSQYQSIFSQRNTLKQQNDQLKAKYKKSLQQLMHILKVNKSLKQYLDQNNTKSQQSIQQQITVLNTSHSQEIMTIKDQLEQCKKVIGQKQKVIKEYQEKNIMRESQKERDGQLINKYIKQLQNSQHNSQNVNNSVQNSSHHTKQQYSSLVSQNQDLKRKILKLLQLSKQKQLLQTWNFQLKQTIKQLNLQLLKQKQKYRTQLHHRQSQLLKSKQQDNFKLNTIQSKYQLMQNQLNHYKSIQKYFQEESKSIMDQQYIYNSIKQQITRINQDFNKYEEESSYLLLKKREENSQRNKKMVELEDQINQYKQKEQKYREAQQKLEQYINQNQKLQTNLKSFQFQNTQLIKKNLILQSLTITQKHRPAPTISDQILQFQQRINLLSLEQSQRSSKVGLHQFIMLKQYISQLSSQLLKSKKKQQQLQTKLQQKKQKTQKKINVYKQKIDDYKTKIKNYDVLINKLYGLIEEKLKEKMPQEIEAEFNMAINYYQEKMLMMSDQIIKLRNNHQKISQKPMQKQKKEVNYHQLQLQQQNQSLKQLISTLSIKNNDLNQQLLRQAKQSQKASSFNNQLYKKQQQITSLTIQLSSLQQISSSYYTQLQSTRLKLLTLQKQLQSYHNELTQKDQTIRKMPKESYSTASLLQKINNLQFQLKKQQNDHIQNQKKLQKVIKDVQVKYKHQQSKCKELQFQINRNQNQKENNRDVIQRLREENREYRGMVENMENITRNNKYDNQENQKLFNKINQYQRKINELQKLFQQSNTQSKLQIKQLNSTIIGLRTTNISLTSQLQTKQDTIHQLKHQAYTTQLKLQKQKSSPSIHKSSSNDLIIDNQKHLMIIALMSAQIQQLRQKKQQLQVMYHEDLDKYKQALKSLQNKQQQICHSLQYSSHKQPQDTIIKSQQQLSIKFDSATKINNPTYVFKTSSHLLGTMSNSKDTQMSSYNFITSQRGERGEYYSANKNRSYVIKKL